MKNLSDYTLEITAVILLFLVWVGLANAQLTPGIITNNPENTTSSDNSLSTGGLISDSTFIVDGQDSQTDDNNITPDPLTAEYSYMACSIRRYTNGTTSGLCSTSYSSIDKEDQCSDNADCPQGSNPDDGQRYEYRSCSVRDIDGKKSGMCGTTISTHDREDECSVDSDCPDEGGGDREPPPDPNENPSEPSPEPENPDGGGEDEDPYPGRSDNCSYCQGENCIIYSRENSYCTNNCEKNPSICKPQEKNKECSYCKGETCYIYQGADYCTKNCSSDEQCKTGGNWDPPADQNSEQNTWYQSAINFFAPKSEDKTTDSSNDGKHLECTNPPRGDVDSTYCLLVNGEGEDQCRNINMLCSGNKDGKHLECTATENKGPYCRLVPGEGPNTCEENTNCGTDNDDWHTVCVADLLNPRCTYVKGEGTDECGWKEGDKNCSIIHKNQHTTCIEGICTWVEGRGYNQCSIIQVGECEEDQSIIEKIIDGVKNFAAGLWIGLIGFFSQ